MFAVGIFGYVIKAFGEEQVLRDFFFFFGNSYCPKWDNQIRNFPILIKTLNSL